MNKLFVLAIGVVNILTGKTMYDEWQKVRANYVKEKVPA